MNQKDFTPLTAAKAVVALYHQQTADEQIVHGTMYRNDAGFNGADASFGTSVAEQILKDRPVTGKQLAALRRMLPKYRKQLEALDFETVTLPAKVTDILEQWGDREVAMAGQGEKKEEEQPKKKSPGTLQLDDSGALEFVPKVYPTTQLKGQGWKKGDRSFWTWVTDFSLNQYNLVLRHWPEVEVRPEVAELVEKLTTSQELPEEIADHPILFPFQKESIQFLTSTPKAMLALAPGLGKTACSIFAADTVTYTADRILVVAPLTLTTVWKREIAKWVGQETTILHGKPPYVKLERWVVTNYDTVRLNLDWFMEQNWAILIVDESVMVKNRKTKRTAAIKKLVSKVPVAWELSGAPTTRFYDDMWAQLNILAPKRFSSYWRFTGDYCLVDHSQWGYSIIGNQPDAARRIQEDLADIYFSRTQDQVLDLPPWIFETIEVPMGKAQWKAYAEMERIFRTTLPEGDFLAAPNVLAQLTRLIQLASNPAVLGAADIGSKWDAVVEMLEWVERPVIVWTSFIKTAEKMQGRLAKAGYTAAVLTGATAQGDRQAIVDMFQAGELDVLIAHPGVGKFGLTLTAARTAIYLERGYNGDDYYQSLHRVRRIGTQYSPVIYHLLATGPNGEHTVDHVIDRVLEYRKDSAIALTTSMLREEW